MGIIVQNIDSHGITVISRVMKRRIGGPFPVHGQNGARIRLKLAFSLSVANFIVTTIRTRGTGGRCYFRLTCGLSKIEKGSSFAKTVTVIFSGRRGLSSDKFPQAGSFWSASLPGLAGSFLSERTGGEAVLGLRIYNLRFPKSYFSTFSGGGMFVITSVTQLRRL